MRSRRIHINFEHVPFKNDPRTCLLNIMSYHGFQRVTTATHLCDGHRVQQEEGEIPSMLMSTAHSTRES